MRLKLIASLAGMILAGCNLPGAGSTNPTTQAPTSTPPAATPSSAPSATATATPPPADLSHHPLYWFAPLPPMTTGPGRPFNGSDDFMQLFSPDAPWEKAASTIQVFKLYGEWVAYNATDAQLRQVVDDLRRRGIALAVEMGPLNAPSDCGQAVEGFAGTQEGRRIASRIKAAGGRIDAISMDEPYFFAHFYDGANACHWDADKIAAQVGSFIRVMRIEFPDIVIGDTEPLAGSATAADYQAWLDTFRAVNGYDLAFLHMDMDWSRATWPQDVKSIEDYGRQRGVPVGIIYTGNWGDSSDEAWLSIAGERVKEYELQAGGHPDHVLFQSWNDKPDRVLPESEPYTFTWFIDAYFRDKASLGFRTSGQGADLAFGKPAQASATEAGHPPQDAVDHDPGTWWSAGAGPVEWILIDLGAAHDIQEIRLTVSQYPAGPTHHVITGKGPGTGDKFVILHSFDGLTADGDVLSFKPDAPWAGIQVIRVQTTTSPSWVAWREIEIIDAGTP